jgi:hypothetical protein
MSEQTCVDGANEPPLVRAEDLLRSIGEDVKVDDGQELHLTVGQRGSSHHFARVHAETIHDLQTLGLVPRGLAEEALKRAIDQDDQAAYEVARESLLRIQASATPCGCEAGASISAEPRRMSFDRVYAQARKTHHPALAALMSDHQKTRFRWDSIHVQSVWGWTDRVGKIISLEPVLVALFQDITIGRGATLVFDAKAAQMFARGIYIHRTGSLTHSGGYLKIWATSISSFKEWNAQTVVAKHVPWSLA